jgi:ABC-type dipeptide/oligopeptide/nickel transport system permease subunit
MTDHPHEPPGLALAPPAAGGGTVFGSSPLPSEPDLLAREAAGLEIEARSQWSYARRRFVRHRLAMGSLAILIVIFGVGAFANLVAPHSYTATDLLAIYTPPTFAHWHLFGTDEIGRDYFSRVIYGIRTTEQVALLVGLLSTIIGTTIGAIAGYFGGWVDNLLMRFTDLILVIPLIAVLLTAAALFGSTTPMRVAILLSLVIWTNIARIVRGSFLSLREKEYVEAARAAGSTDRRIIIRHILPNTVGPILVAATLTTGTAILLESTLSFLGFGIRDPQAALGLLIANGDQQGLGYWWLVTFPGLVIVLIVLCINFVGDGLRDALDPTQRRTRA